MKHDTATAAAQLGVKAKTLENWRSAGTGPAYFKVGSRVLYDQADLDSWLAARRQTSTAENRRSAA
jgi:excisionase family DNA binding protein